MAKLFVISLTLSFTTAATDAFGLGTSLPACSGSQTADAILMEILRNRNIELAYSGFRLEDSRRFGRPGPGVAGSERNRNFLPSPRTERDNNSSTPQLIPVNNNETGR